jgi:DNA-binding transcriptional regulator/RsmH inhibitor MraZ
MSSSAKVHESHVDHKMDPKFRVSIPVEWRPATDKTPIRLQLSKEHELPVIKVYSEEEFDLKFEQVANSTLSQARQKQIVGHLRMMSKKAVVSEQGKLTVPKDWSEQIGLEAEGLVILAGRGPYYMLCAPSIFEQIKQIEQGMDDGDLGVL